MSSKSERLKSVRLKLKMNQEQFAEFLGIKQSNISKVESDKIPISSNLELRLFTHLPNLNPLWFETGDGQMFFEKPILHFGEVREDAVEYGKGIKKVPYYDVDVSAGDFSFFTDESPDLATAELEVPFFVDCDFAVRVYGNSMSGKFNPGDVIFVKEISHWRDFVSYGEPYLVLYGDGERRVKYLKRSEKLGYYRMVSENAHYDDYDVPIDKITRVFLVKGKLEKMSL